MQTLLVPTNSPLESFSLKPRNGAFATIDRLISVKAIPYKLATALLPCDMRETTGHEKPDVILLNDLNAARLIDFHVSEAVAAIVPVIDAAGYQQNRNNDNAQRADLRIAAVSEPCISQAIPKIISMIERVHRLPQSVFTTSDRRLHLMARLFVRSRGMTPRYDSSKPDLLHYQDESVIPNLIQHAESLADLGALDRRVFETLTLCPSCGSARLLTRPTAQPRGARRPIHCIDCDAEHATGLTTSRTFFSYHLAEIAPSSRSCVEA